MYTKNAQKLLMYSSPYVLSPKEETSTPTQGMSKQYEEVGARFTNLICMQYNIYRVHRRNYLLQSMTSSRSQYGFKTSLY